MLDGEDGGQRKWCIRDSYYDVLRRGLSPQQAISFTVNDRVARARLEWQLSALLHATPTPAIMQMVAQQGPTSMQPPEPVLAPKAKSRPSSYAHVVPSNPWWAVVTTPLWKRRHNIKSRDPASEHLANRKWCKKTEKKIGKIERKEASR